MINALPKTKQKAIAYRKRRNVTIYQTITNRLYELLIQDGWLFVGVGLLLGRAIILSVISPFAVSYLAALWMAQRRHTLKVMVAIVLGALSQSQVHAFYVSVGMILFLCCMRLFQHIRRVQLIFPFVVFFSTAFARFLIDVWNGPVMAYELVLLLVEGVLSMVLVLILMQISPLIYKETHRMRLKSEELICVVILLASILTGTIGWLIYGIPVEQILSRYFVLILSFVGGAAIGSTGGVIVGLILSLADITNVYQMSMLAFSGLLGGLLKEGGKLSVSVGLFVGTTLLSIYGLEETVMSSAFATAIAIGLFFITPTKRIKQLATYVPNTIDHKESQEQYVQKVRDVTAQRVEQFSSVFQALSKSFAITDEMKEDAADKTRETDQFLSQVTERTCQMCFMKERCWQKQFDQTYSLMDYVKERILHDELPRGQLFRQFENHCVKSKQVIHVMQEEAAHFTLNKRLQEQVMESKRLVADQLQGVSDVMDDFAREIMKEREFHEEQERQIMEALDRLHIRLEKLEIYQLEKGNIDIEMMIHSPVYHGEARKLIAPVLSDIFGETVVVKREETVQDEPNYIHFVFGSNKQFVVQTGVAAAAKNGGLLSGDSYTTIEIGTGKYALAISDGMGNGKRASEESKETLHLLQQILQTGISEKVAIKSLNSILSLRTTDEMFATLDLAVINLHNAAANFLKIGSAPSFIFRNGKMIDVEGSNLPIGIIQEFDVESVKYRLYAGDLLIMMSDGIYEGPKHIAQMDVWLGRKLQEMETGNPEAIADLLLEAVIRENAGMIDDDMTIVVAKIERNVPEWTTFSLHSDQQLRTSIS